MTPNHTSFTPKVAGVYSSIFLVATLIGGCTGSKISGPRTKNPERVALNDFVNPDAISTSSTQTDNETTGIDPNLNSKTQPITTETVDGITLSSSETSTPVIRTVNPNIPTSNQTGQNSSSSDLHLLDAKVGDVNGKPIFTNSFFEPIEDRLLAEAGRLSPANWRRSAGQTISNRLDGIIADELLRAEALASLTPNQRVGLQAFLGNFRNNLLSQNLGSSQLASRRLQQQQGQTLDEALRQKEVDTLVQLTLIQEVNRRVNVSWRDIKQRYERDIEEFSPPPTAVFRVVRTFKDNTEKVAQIQSELDSGTDFLKVAAGPLNNYNSDSDGMHEVLIEDTYETTVFFGPDELNEATQSLSTGQVAGPIELGSSVYWIKLMRIEQESISLYDAQLKIQSELSFERKQEARIQYLDRLMERARVSSRDEVLLRLLQIADERYGPQG
ncbi:MAG: peptidylprolyl isomerase [Phycisphaerales bacterium]|nr:peptidylprolyl isomerase [Phycisphaerales bacterium]